ncbi:MAG: hypothetical protein U9Q66_03720, partial [Patescibacteria group bacterium]|nr:hypothetical protein [Patescibacteria group bacterium]
EANIEELVKESDRKSRTVQAQIDKLVVDSTLTERHVAKAEKDIEIADEQLSIAKAEVAIKEKSLEKMVSDIALTSRQVSLTEAQTVEQLTDTGRKTNWSNKDLEVKSTQITKLEKDTLVTEKNVEMVEAQKDEVRASTIRKDKDLDTSVAIKERQVAKTEEEVRAISADTTRKDEDNKKNIALKQAQITKVYREAMVTEQQQLMLAQQIKYEVKKTETLDVNTKANIMIRVLDGLVTEMTTLLSKEQAPTKFIEYISKIREELISLADKVAPDGISTDGNGYGEALDFTTT